MSRPEAGRRTTTFTVFPFLKERSLWLSRAAYASNVSKRIQDSMAERFFTPYAPAVLTHGTETGVTPLFCR